MEKKYIISVRNLVEYVYRSGNIDRRFQTTNSLTEGTRIHQSIQSTYSEDDQKEVSLKTEMMSDDIRFLIEGRCDGLLNGPDGPVIEEIKSTSVEFNLIDENSNQVYWAQAMCYGYMVCLEKKLDQIVIQLTYVHTRTNQLKKFCKTLTIRELETFMHNLVDRYTPFASLQLQNREEKLVTSQQLTFPFEHYRNGQRKLMGAAFKTIQERKNLFALAPTGIGKTISMLFPTIKMFGEMENRIERVYYLTAKTITRQVAEETVTLFVQTGLKIKALTITAKDKICQNMNDVCQPDHCEFCIGHFDRINEAVLDILRNEQMMTKDCLLKYAQKHQVCPFEFSIELAYLADIIICDYNYIFDPRVYLKRLSDDQKKRSVILIDEAHNLVERGREMFSAILIKSNFLQLYREYKETNPGLSQTAKSINRYFIELRKQMDEQNMKIQTDLPNELLSLAEQFILEAESELAKKRLGESSTLLLETYYLVQNFIRISKYYHEKYITYIMKEKNEIRLKMFCLDPSTNINTMSKKYAAKIFYSATLTPASYYMDALGAQNQDYKIQIASPYSPEQLDVWLQPISTRFTDRLKSIVPITTTIKGFIQKGGNYLVFFPSYQYLLMVVEELVELNGEFNILIQRHGMSEEEKENFLAAFEENPDKPVIGFVVMGGMFSEGIDLVGNRLNGVIIIGVGMPQINKERDLIKQYYQAIGKNGFDYAYVYPGINKVLQAAGRLIRSESDRGTLVLIDDRYLQPKYQTFFPELWKPYRLIKKHKRQESE